MGVFEWTAKDPMLSRPVYVCGHTYAVQPGRGKPAIWWRKANNATEYAHMSYSIEDDLYAIHGNYPVEGDEMSSDYEYLKEFPAQLKEHGYQEARIRITDIREGDVRNISGEDAKAEGFESTLDFLATWIEMHDKRIWLSKMNYPLRNMQIGDWYMQHIERGIKWTEDSASEEFIWSAIRSRPAERYQAWVLTYELVQS